MAGNHLLFDVQDIEKGRKEVFLLPPGERRSGRGNRVGLKRLGSQIVE